MFIVVQTFNTFLQADFFTYQMGINFSKNKVQWVLISVKYFMSVILHLIILVAWFVRLNLNSPQIHLDKYYSKKIRIQRKHNIFSEVSSV